MTNFLAKVNYTITPITKKSTIIFQNFFGFNVIVFFPSG